MHKIHYIYHFYDDSTHTIFFIKNIKLKTLKKYFKNILKKSHFTTMCTMEYHHADVFYFFILP